MLTIEKLKEMKPGIFAQGEVNDPRLYKEPVNWVAVRGGIHDWAIYYHKADKSWEFIKSQGDKVMTEAVIKDLVHCNEEAYQMYRR